MERRVWSRVRDRRLSGWKFRRQAPVGPYVVDFLCIDAKLVIELDGGQHSPVRDAARDRYLAACGFLVLRFWNGDVATNLDGVLAETLATLSLRGASPHPNPLPAGERGQVAPSRVDATPAAGAGQAPSPRRGEGGGEGARGRERASGRAAVQASIGEAGR
jgi:very-short-patch-repair endonuclease